MHVGLLLMLRVAACFLTWRANHELFTREELPHLKDHDAGGEPGARHAMSAVQASA